MKHSKISAAQARLKLAILNKQAEAKSTWEFYSETKNFGFPGDVIEILTQILGVTSKVAGKTISIGRIVVFKLLEYVAKHPLQVAGLAAGLCSAYALGTALHGLFSAAPFLAQIPILGGKLAALALLVAKLCRTVFMPLMAISPIAGAVVGEIIDSKFPAVSESLQVVAKDFFYLFSQIIDTIRGELKSTNYSQGFA